MFLVNNGAEVDHLGPKLVESSAATHPPPPSPDRKPMAKPDIIRQYGISMF